MFQYQRTAIHPGNPARQIRHWQQDQVPVTAPPLPRQRQQSTRFIWRVRKRRQHDLIVAGDFGKRNTLGGQVPGQSREGAIARRFDHDASPGRPIYLKALDPRQLAGAGDCHDRAHDQFIRANLGHGAGNQARIGRLGPVFEAQRHAPFPITQRRPGGVGQFGRISPKIPKIPRSLGQKRGIIPGLIGRQVIQRRALWPTDQRGQPPDGFLILLKKSMFWSARC